MTSTSAQTQPPNHAPIEDYLNQLSIGRKQSFRNLEIFPLLSAGSAPADYLLLDQALARNLVLITEISQAGSVPELRLENKSSLSILILDGEELIGAKQNRIVNTTMLIAGLASAVIPVSCVEQGRWSYRGHAFGSLERMMYAAARARKNEQVICCLRTAGSFRSDQGEIWDEIARKSARRGASSPSCEMSAIYEKDQASLDDYLGRFHFLPDQLGAVFAINGRVAGLECFSGADTLRAVFDKLVRSYALDAIDLYQGSPGRDTGNTNENAKKNTDKNTKKNTTDNKSIDQIIGKAHRRHALRFLDLVRTAPVETRPSVSMGEDHRLDAPLIAGLALSHQQKLLHLSVFARARDAGPAAGP